MINVPGNVGGKGLVSWWKSLGVGKCWKGHGETRVSLANNAI